MAGPNSGAEEFASERCSFERHFLQGQSMTSEALGVFDPCDCSRRFKTRLAL